MAHFESLVRQKILPNDKLTSGDDVSRAARHLHKVSAWGYHPAATTGCGVSEFKKSGV
jgi:hypothetical protein